MVIERTDSSGKFKIDPRQLALMHRMQERHRAITKRTPAEIRALQLETNERKRRREAT